MRIIGIDFETFFAVDYNLDKSTTEEYVRDPRFEAHGAAVLDTDTNRSWWMRPKELAEQCEVWRMQQRHGETIAMLAHHAHFDGLILSHHFNFCPDVWLCTLSMGRVVFDSGIRKRLGALAQRLGLPDKTLPYDQFKGLYWDEMGEHLQRAVAAGCQMDIMLTWHIFQFMMKAEHPAIPYAFPVGELPVVSLTVKMFTEPVLIGNLAKLGEAWQHERKAEREMFASLGFENMDQDAIGAMLRKDEVFADLLRQLDVEPDTKLTAKGNEKYAFAKSDYQMQDLCAHEDPDVAALAEARLKAHSSIYQTRVERYGDMATRGAMCIYLAFAAAHTRRWGGGDKTNFQNLPRPDPYRPQKGALRRAIEAPQ